ncbi:MAG: hypothetical protein FWC27_06160 [Firmicutes bacterium]|nr:hypothetical protein [Bacillota bacterium]
MKYFWGWYETEKEMEEAIPALLDWSTERRQRPISLGDELDDETIDEIEPYHQLIDKIGNERFYFEMLIENFHDVFQAISDTKKESKKIKDITPYIRKVHRLFLNALGSMYIYMGHIQHYSNVDTKALRDNHSLYKFLHDLRTFSIHDALPIIELRSSSKTMQFIIVKDAILQSEFKYWGSQAKDAFFEILCHMSDEIDLQILIQDAVNLFTKFHVESLRERQDAIITAQLFYDRFARKSEKGCQYPYAFAFDGEKTVKCVGSLGVFVNEIRIALDQLGIDAYVDEVIS